jgi:hypothetical protein
MGSSSEAGLLFGMNPSTTQPGARFCARLSSSRVLQLDSWRRGGYPKKSRKYKKEIDISGTSGYDIDIRQGRSPRLNRSAPQGRGAAMEAAPEKGRFVI